MRLPLQLARRYLLGKKSTNAINIISSITIFGLTIGTAALIIILSVFNGFEGLLSGLFNPFNPDLEIKPSTGKSMLISDELRDILQNNEGIDHYSICIEDLALFQYDDIQEIGILKGVDNSYSKVTSIDTTLLYGRYTLENNGIQKGLIGSTLRAKLGIQINQSLLPLTVYTPLKKPKAGREFNRQEMYPSGVVSIQSDSDHQYIIGSYGMAARLFEKPGEWSSIEIKVTNDDNVDQVQSDLAKMLPNLTIKNRYEQDESYLKLLRIEKWIAFLIVGFTLLLIAFNLVASLWMIVLEKKNDFATLVAMGFEKHQVSNTVICTGMLMSAIGLFLGFVIAISFFILQKKLGLLTMSETFIVPSYPIEMRFTDFIIVALTVLSIGFFGSLLPARRASNVTANVRLEG